MTFLRLVSQINFSHVWMLKANPSTSSTSREDCHATYRQRFFDHLHHRDHHHSLVAILSAPQRTSGQLRGCSPTNQERSDDGRHGIWLPIDRRSLLRKLNTEPSLHERLLGRRYCFGGHQTHHHEKRLLKEQPVTYSQLGQAI